MSWIKHLDKKSSTTGTSDPALDNLAKHKPERADFLRRQRKFNNLLSKLRSFVHDYPVEKMNTGELVFMKELSDLRLEWLNKVTEAKDVNPHWDIRDLDKPDTTVEGSLSFKVSFREPIGRRVIMEAYQTVTPESVEQGDFADHGINDEEAFVLEPSEIVDEVEYHNANYEPSITYHDYIVDRTVEYLRRQGVMGASASHFHEEVWYETEGHVTDYGTLETTTNSYHLRGYTVEEEEAIFNKLKEDRYIPRL